MLMDRYIISKQDLLLMVVQKLKEWVMMKFSPRLLRYSTIRFALASANIQDLDVHQKDVKTTLSTDQ